MCFGFLYTQIAFKVTENTNFLVAHCLSHCITFVKKKKLAMFICDFKESYNDMFLAESSVIPVQGWYSYPDD